MSKYSNAYNTSTDEQVMKLFKVRRDANLYNIIYRRYFHTLCKYAYWMCGNRLYAEDVSQDILVKLYHNPDLFDTTQNLKVWLYVSIKNRIKNYQRNQSRRSNRLEELRIYSNSEQGELQTDEKAIRLKRIRKTMNKLSSDHKEVVTLKYSNNLTISEISDVLQCSEGTVKSRLYYAIRNLKLDILSIENKK